MAKRIIRTGTTADPTGDSLKNAFTKVNDNFTELYNALGLDVDLLNLGAFEFTGSVMTTTDSTPIVIDQAVSVTSDLTVGGDIVPNIANGGNLGSSTLPWRSLYVSNNTIYIGGTAVGIDANGALTTGGTVVGSTPAWNSITGKPTFAAVATGGTLNADTLRTAPLHIESTSYIDISSGGSNGVGRIDINALSGDLTLLSSDNVIIQSGNDSWTFIGGANPFVTFPAITGGDQLQIQGAEVSTIAGNLALTSVTDINIISNGSGLAPGGSKTWTFGDNGSLTLPGDIHSEGNIDISINLDDSTTQTWSFGEDGDFKLPRGYIKNNTTDGFLRIEGPLFADMVSLGGGGYATISNGVEILTHTVGSDTERKFRFSWDGSLYMPTDNSNSQVGAIEWRLDNGATAQVKSTAGGGFYNIPTGLQFLTYNGAATTISVEFDKNWIFRGDGSLTIPGDIRSNGNINIDINLADSTLRRWQFGEDGALTLPDGTNYSGNNIAVPSGGIPTAISNINSSVFWDEVPTSGLIPTGGSGVGLTVSVTDFASGYADTIIIDTTGSGYTDGDIITVTSGNASATFTISTSHTWTLGTTGRTTFPNGTVPAHSYGAAGDKEGMVVFTDPYIYYCKQDYVNNSTDIWVRVAWTGTNW